MHRGFKIELEWESEEYYKKGLTQFDYSKAVVENTLKKFVGKDGLLKGTELQENWFPQVEADIFISHSHTDRQRAIAFAGWLQEAFGLKVFVDSCIWGFADDLLRLIDSRFCSNPDGKTFNYEKRNQSTSHVHMMLSTALSMMIDKTECLFFLNTPNSIQTVDTINKTKSPWIYNEIAISQIVRKKQLSEYRPVLTKAFTRLGRIDESAIANYDVSLAHLQELTEEDMDRWEECWNDVSLHEKYPLNKLYELFPVNKYL